MPSGAGPRLFFAVWPPPESARALAEWALEAKRACGGRATAAENIHLTLAFLGEADPARAIAAAQRVRAHRFDLPMEEAQFWRHNRIVWVGPRELPRALAQLADALHQELFKEQFKLETRPFAAHITLLRKATDPEGLPPLTAPAWPVDEFLLVSSALSDAGSRYTVEKRFALS